MRSFLIALCLTIATVSIGQSSLIKKADSHRDGLYFRKASTLYLKAIKKDPSNTYVLRQLGDCYSNLGDHQEAAMWYQKCLDQDDHKSYDAYKYGQCLIAMGNFDRGSYWLKQYFAEHPADPSKRLLEECYSLDQIAQTRKDIAIKPMNANGNMSVMAPSMLDEVLIVAIDEDLPPDWEPAMRMASRADIYKMSTNKKFELKMATPLSEELVTDQHEIVSAYDPVDELLYVTRVKQKRSKVIKDELGHPHLEVVRYEQKGKKWHYKDTFDFNSSDHSVGFISFNLEKDLIYFCSNDPSGKGGFDIYSAHRDGNTWKNASNLDIVNTQGNECYTNYHEGNLYFASDGLVGLGGFDLYSYGAENITNLGTPYNSSKDDYSISFLSSSKGYFSSNRGDKNGDDLIMFEQMSSQQLVQFNIQSTDEAYVMMTNTTTGTSDKLYIDNAQFSALMDTETVYDIDFPNSGEKISCQFLENQSFRFTESSVIKMDAEIQSCFVSEINQTRDLGDKHYHKNLCMNQSYMELPSEDNAYFGGDLATCNAAIAKAKVFLKDPETGHTVATWTDENGKFEAFLPKNRNYEVRSELGELLLSPNLDAMAYAALTEVYDHPKHTPRTDEPEYLIVFDVPKMNDVPGEQTDYTPVEQSAPLKDAVEEGALEAGTYLRMNPVYFAYNKTDIKESDMQNLLVTASTLKKNPAIHIEIVAHTDSRGSKGYNERLSRRRAESTKEALISLGVQETQIELKWKGEEQTVNGCTDMHICEEDLHRMNRRAEMNLFIPENYAML